MTKIFFPALTLLILVIACNSTVKHSEQPSAIDTTKSVSRALHCDSANIILLKKITNQPHYKLKVGGTFQLKSISKWFDRL
jgi:hypothetical protein